MDNLYACKIVSILALSVGINLAMVVSQVSYSPMDNASLVYLVILIVSYAHLEHKEITKHSTVPIVLSIVVHA